MKRALLSQWSFQGALADRCNLSLLYNSQRWDSTLLAKD